MRTRIAVAAGLMWTLTQAAQAQNPPHFKLTDLGVLPNTTSSQATAISDSGIIAGFSATGMVPVNGPASGRVVGNSTGFLYSQGVMTAIDGSTAVQGTAAAIMIPRGVTNSGDFAGVAQIAGQPQPRRVIYQGGQFLTLPLPQAIYLFAMNAAGQVGGGGDLTQGNVAPLIWQAGVVTGLPASGNEAVVFGLSPSGMACGMDAGSKFILPVMWVNKLEHFFPLPAGFDNGEIFSINNSAQAVGMVFFMNGPGATLLNNNSISAVPPASAAFFANGQTTVLPSLPGAVATFATGINDAGWIVGYGINQTTDFFDIEFDLDFGLLAPAATDRHAAMWINGSVYDLTSLVVSNGSGWQLTSATAINSSGQIVGSGIIGGHQHAFLLTPVGSGSMAQIVSAGTFDTSLTAVNLGTSAVPTSLSFFNDPDGSPLSLPFTFPQGSVAPLTASSVTQNINPNAQFILDTTGPSSTASVGWSQLSAAADVAGFGIFHDPTFGWNAVVPLETRNALSYLLAFDNTGALATGVALANVSTSAAAINVIFRDDTGAQIGTDTINLAPQGHMAFMLNVKYGFTANLRGTVEFDTPTGGQISVLGLRANGPALTTLPVLADVDVSGGSLTHLAYNGGFTSVFTLVNTGTTSAQATLNFYDDNGNPLSVSLTLPQTGGNFTGTSLTRMLAPGASLVLDTVADDAATNIEGSAQLITTGNVSGFVIFRWTTFGQEASVPLETRAPGSYVLVFDDTGVLTTGVAVTNLSGSQANIPVTIRDDTGAVLQSTSLGLKPNGHKSFLLPGTYDSTAGVRGTVEFAVPATGKISVIGLRATNDGTLTTIPIFAK